MGVVDFKRKDKRQAPAIMGIQGFLIDIEGRHALDMDAFQFCLRVLLKNPVSARPHFRHLLIKDGYVVATDGCRIHRAKLYGRYCDGLYRVLKRTSAHVILFLTDLSISDNYPTFEHMFEHDDVDEVVDSFWPDNYLHAMARLLKRCPDGWAVNPQHVKDLDDKFAVQILSFCFVFKNDVKQAALMPVRGSLSSASGMV